MMDYYESLRRGGWLPDPGDRVRVVPQHATSCPSLFGGFCRCAPLLVLAGTVDEDEAEQLAAAEHAS